MQETIKVKDVSPLVRAVLELDNHLSELNRIGSKLEQTELKSEFDFQQARKLMALFAEQGEGVARQVAELSKQLNEAQQRAGLVATRVAEQSEIINSHDTEQQKKFEQFRVLGEKVRAINNSMAALRQPEGKEVTEEDRKRIYSSLLEFDTQLDPLIIEAQTLLRDAQDSKMKFLEQNADSLAQTLLTLRRKIRELNVEMPRH